MARTNFEQLLKAGVHFGHLKRKWNPHMAPYIFTETEGQYDVNVNVYGGGINGQADAVRLAMSKALVEINPEWKPSLKEVGLMTRDPRMVERKKPGLKKARKREQFSKR